MSVYKGDFFSQRHDRTVYAAQTILSIVKGIIPPVRSAVDVGCGVGTWLSVLKAEGTDVIQGVDGNWVNDDDLVISADNFKRHDLSKGLDFGSRFDLLISLEVAEHLPPEVAASFVSSLAELSDYILFSAAIPFQGGKHHVNEQWPSYWADLFAAHDYTAVDCIRHSIWSDEKIASWYKQNTVLFVQASCLQDLNLSESVVKGEILALVHPDTYLKKMRNPWKLFRKALKHSMSGNTVPRA